MRVVGNREGFVSLWECNTCMCVGLIKEEVIDVVSIHNPNESCNVEMTVSKGAEGCVRYVKCSPFQKELMLCFFSVFASPTPKLSLSPPPFSYEYFCVCFLPLESLRSFVHRILHVISTWHVSSVSHSIAKVLYD